ncbi:hypothetical protein FNE58_04010 [Bacillus thuringiensis]|uniref:PXO1-02 n=2 Tax=Bacillus TaxID=1386 RepID=A0A9X6KQA5_BACTU|nr:hypothetical protein BT4G5_32070 [Bacillus thuringiensis serovar galleriae]ETE88541.1 hypothetical protein C623_0234195 [Bacillus thuringiensis serovar aizawai str. Hu4-2]KAB1374734.1 hypothetical protein FPG93_27865 [Bacillus thuringiensis]KLA36333.1 hypothetical protein B4158_5777 [Bacillus cereus]OIX17837.1 hypothetical protein BMT18_21015 [Bacillus thuringiensis serovar aizawai]
MDSITNHIYKKRMLEHTILFSLAQLVPLIISTGIIYILLELTDTEWKTWFSYEGIFAVLFLITRFQVFQNKKSIISLNQYEKWFSKLNIFLISIFLVLFASIPTLLKIAFILQMTIILFLLERICLYIERLPIHNLYRVKEIVCDKKQLQIERIIPNNEEHGTHTIKTKDGQYFLYTAVYLSGILSPISKEVFEEYERKNLMGR